MKITCNCNSSCQLIPSSDGQRYRVLARVRSYIYENWLWNIFVVLSSTTTKKKPKEVMPKRTCENIKLLMTQKYAAHSGKCAMMRRYLLCTIMSKKLAQ